MQKKPRNSKKCKEKKMMKKQENATQKETDKKSNGVFHQMPTKRSQRNKDPK